MAPPPTTTAAPGPLAIKLVTLDQQQYDLCQGLLSVSAQSASPEQGVALFELGQNLAQQADLLPRYNDNASAATRHSRCNPGDRESEINQLLEENASLEDSLAQVRQQLQVATMALDVVRRTGTTSSDRKFVNIPNPPEFEKGRSEYRTFKAKLGEKLRGDATKFRDEEHKLSYALGFLKGQAYEQVAPLRQAGDIDTISKLIAFLDATFEDPDPSGTAERELRSLRQGKTEFSAHLAKFQQLMAVLKWEGAPKRCALIASLSDELKDVLSYHAELPTEFLKLVALLQALDNNIRIRATERKTLTAPVAKRNPPALSGTPTASANPRDSWANPQYTGPAPMDLAAKKRQEDRQAQYAKWAAEGVCTKCGSPNHWRGSCPRNPRNLKAAAAATATAATPPSTIPVAPTTDAAAAEQPKN